MKLWKRTGQGKELTVERKRDRGFWWAAALVMICALIMLGCYPGASEAVQRGLHSTESAEDNSNNQSWPEYDGGGEMNLKSFIRYMYMGSYGMYWELQQKIGQCVMTPSQVFFPGISLSDGNEAFDDTFSGWFSAFGSLLDSYEVEYQIIDQKTGSSYSNSSQNLRGKFESEEEMPFFLALVFGEDGAMTMEELQNQDGLELELGSISGLTPKYFLNWIECRYLSPALMKLPSNVEIYIYSPDANCYYGRNDGRIGDGYNSYNYWALISDAVLPAYLILRGYWRPAP